MTGDLDRWEHHVTLAARLADATSPSLAAGAMSECALVRFLRGGGIQRELGVRAATLARAAPDGASITTPLLDAELNLAIQLLIAGELDEARTLIHARRSRARAGDTVAQSAVTAEASWSAYLLTELELRAGRWALADQHAQAAAAADASRAGNADAAIDAHRQLADPFGRARTLLARGTILGRAGQRREAHATLDQARALFTHLGATLWIARTDRETQQRNAPLHSTEARTRR
jgi:hypothetical protein